MMMNVGQSVGVLAARQSAQPKSSNRNVDFAVAVAGRIGLGSGEASRGAGRQGPAG